MNRYLKNKSFITGLAMVLAMALIMLIGFVWMPYDPTAQELTNKLKLPSTAHLLGTDQFGRDILSRIMQGIRISFMIGLAVTAAGGVIGTLIGAFCGYFGGAVDEICMKLVDAMMAFPGVLLALMLIAVFGNGISNTVAALTIMAIPRFVRISRSGYMRNREAEYVKAERVRGASPMRIMFRHILGNITSELAATASLTFAGAIMSEAGLSYLGMGVTPPHPSLGQMLSEAQDSLLRAPWYVLIPTGVITLLVLGFNLMGDGIQQADEQE